jgi:phosphoribosylanthranilate isomerase
MSARTHVKICGINSPAAARAAARADFAGFNFYPPSPRQVTPARAARLAKHLSPRVKRVAVLVDPDDAQLRDVIDTLQPHFLQLHGKETPARVAAIRRAYKVKVIKALGISTKADFKAEFKRVEPYLAVADVLLFDAKPPKRRGALPGGNAVSFDWTLLAGKSWKLPWLLSGGLSPDNVAEALRIAGAPAVDVSSGVEDRVGHKSPARIAAFIDAARGPRSRKKS